MSLASLVRPPLCKRSQNPAATCSYKAPISPSKVPPERIFAFLTPGVGTVPRAGLNAGPISLTSSFLGFSTVDGIWRGRSRAEVFRCRGLQTGRDVSGKRRQQAQIGVRASTGLQETVVGIMDAAKAGWTTYPPTWESSLISIGIIFVLGAPALFVGLTKAGIASAYVLGTVIWRAFGLEGLLTIMCFYFLMGFGKWCRAHRKKASVARGTAATKLKMKEKQKEGIAEKRSGRRGVGSVMGSGTAALICALCSIYQVGGPDVAPLWQMGYLASLCTKLSDTISSEIGKAYGKTTYLVTNFSIVPRGTEGAVSLEGTVAGIVAAIFIASASFALNQVDQAGAIIAVFGSQLANLIESFLGATVQGRPGYAWLSNDIVNVVNVVVGAAIAMIMRRTLS